MALSIFHSLVHTVLVAEAIEGPLALVEGFDPRAGPPAGRRRRAGGAADPDRLAREPCALRRAPRPELARRVLPRAPGPVAAAEPGRPRHRRLAGAPAPAAPVGAPSPARPPRPSRSGRHACPSSSPIAPSWPGIP